MEEDKPIELTKYTSEQYKQVLIFVLFFGLIIAVLYAFSIESKYNELVLTYNNLLEEANLCLQISQ